MPLSLEWFAVQRSITRTIQLKLEQFCAPWGSVGFLRFLLIPRGKDWVLTVDHDLAHCLCLPPMNSDTESGPDCSSHSRSHSHQASE